MPGQPRRRGRWGDDLIGCWTLRLKVLLARHLGVGHWLRRNHLGGRRDGAVAGRPKPLNSPLGILEPPDELEDLLHGQELVVAALLVADPARLTSWLAALAAHLFATANWSTSGPAPGGSRRPGAGSWHGRWHGRWLDEPGPSGSRALCPPSRQLPEDGLRLVLRVLAVTRGTKNCGERPIRWDH